MEIICCLRWSGSLKRAGTATLLLTFASSAPRSGSERSERALNSGSECERIPCFSSLAAVT